MQTLQSQSNKGLKKPMLRYLIQQLEMKNNHVKEQQKYNTLTRYANPQLSGDSVKLSKIWKATGYGNRQFGGIKSLRSRALNEWEIQRMQLAKRSYQSPKDFKGIKHDVHSRQFTIRSNKSLYTKEFNKYLQTIKQKYQENLFRPNATELQKITDWKKQLSVSKLKFSTSNNFFGVPKQGQKLGTLKSFKSQMLRKSDSSQ